MARPISVPACVWRQAHARDAATIADLARRLLGAFPEEDAVFAERIQLCPTGCCLLVEGDAALGYVISHPWRRRSPPALNTLVGDLPADPDCWYIHDISIDESCRGTGAVEEMVQALVERAGRAGIDTLALVAVGGTATYWKRHGFLDATDARLRRKLASYGGDAVYMERQVRPAA